MHLNWYFIILGTALFGCQETMMVERVGPNIILILTDDQGWGDLSSNGNLDLNTPNIDRLAHEGATFDRFYVCPVCSPTRAEILTGRYHTRSGVYSTSAGGERIDLDEKLLPEYFQEAGYSTAAFGKWHNGMQAPYHPNARGFDEFYGFCSGHWGNYYSPMLEHNGAIVKGEGFLTDDLTEKAMHYVEEHRDEPFFVYLPLQTPHSPMQVPERWWSRHATKDLKMIHPDSSAKGLLHTRAALAMCENIDYNVGRFVDKIDELELAENTLILYLSDNGPNGYRWNGGMRGRKGSTDEGGVRSPLIARWKGTIEAGKKIVDLGAAIDFLPTLTELAGLTAKAQNPWDGESLASLLLASSNEPTADRKIINHWRGRTSVRNKRFRLDHENKLYDMVADPGQMVDVSSAHQEDHHALLAAKGNFDQNVVTELPKDDLRAFPVGAPGHIWTQLPARDAVATGTITRSNRWPNDSFYENWTSTKDSIYWDVEVLEPGNFEAILYYTCALENVGCTLQLSSATTSASSSITEAHDPPLVGAAEDRFPREESYTKDFQPKSLGKLNLVVGPQRLILTASDLVRDRAVDFRLLMLKRISAQN